VKGDNLALLDRPLDWAQEPGSPHRRTPAIKGWHGAWFIQRAVIEQTVRQAGDIARTIRCAKVAISCSILVQAAAYRRGTAGVACVKARLAGRNWRRHRRASRTASGPMRGVRWRVFGFRRDCWPLPCRDQFGMNRAAMSPRMT